VFVVASARLSVVLSAMADALRDGAPSSIDGVCGAAVSLLSLSGAGISLMVDGELRGTAGTTGSETAAVQELELTLGEGPCLDAWATRAPVLEADLVDPAIVRWPAFAGARATAHVGAVFAFPVSLGAIRIGVLVLYREHPGALSTGELGQALVLADVATHVILGLQAGAEPGGLHAALSDELLHWPEVHQATGMVSVQLAVPLDDAFVRLRGYAFSHEQTLRAVARDVVARRLNVAHPA
jgi:hypothetical protein